MFVNRVLSSVTALAVALPGPMALAGTDDIVGGIIGGVIGGAIANSARQSQPRTVTRTRTVTRRAAPAVSSAQRQENREVQTALNYFGFDAGAPDGVLGRRSRAAISSMESFLNLPPDGQLTSFEKNILLSAHNRAISGNPDTVRLISTSPLGARAALQAQKDLMTGGTGQPQLRTTGYPGLPLEVSRAVDEVAASSDPSPEQLLQRSGFIQLSDLNGDGRNDYIIDTSFSGSSFWCSASECKTMVFVSTPDGYARNELLAHSPTAATFECYGASCRLAENANEPVVASTPSFPAPAESDPGTTLAAAPEAPATLPSFGAAASGPSLASHCGKVNLLTATRGGFVDVSSGGDRTVALAEQFCLARNFAIDEGEQLVAAMPGTTMDMVQAQCGSFGPAMAGQLTALSSAGEKDVLGQVSAFALTTGMLPEQLRQTATLCLAAGYRADDMGVALGSALLLVAMGSAPHAELLGHHLNDGFGTTKRPDLAAEWYATAIRALDGGAAPVFAPNQAGRTALLTWASAPGQGAAVPAPVAPVAAALPTFAAPAEE
ncbi:MAG: peptidoglycan-binding domain-containing protein [Pseudomonadota bacterium]